MVKSLKVYLDLWVQVERVIWWGRFQVLNEGNDEENIGIYLYGGYWKDDGGFTMIGENFKMRAPRAIWMENLFVIGTCGRWYWAHSWMILCMISDIDYVLNCFVWSGYFSKCIIKAIPSIRFLIKRKFSSWLGDESVLICQGLCGEPDRTTGTPPGSDIFIIWTNGFRFICYCLSSRIIWYCIPWNWVLLATVWKPKFLN